MYTDEPSKKFPYKCAEVNIAPAAKSRNTARVRVRRWPSCQGCYGQRQSQPYVACCCPWVSRSPPTKPRCCSCSAPRLIMSTLLQNGLFKLALVFVISWLGLFTVFVTFSAFLRSPEFEHPVSIIPNGVVEQRVVPLAALQSYPLSPINQDILSTMTFPYLTLTFDTTPGRLSNKPLRGSSMVDISAASRHISPWSTFGVRAADAVLLNDMVHGRAWGRPSLKIHSWPGEKSADHETIHLSLKAPFHPGDEFASLVRTNDSWSVQLAPTLHASAPSRALPFQRTIAVLLWPVLFQNFLRDVGMAGVFLLWVCAMTTGYATLTIMVTHWMVRKNGGEARRRQGAALRWEEEGWAYMGVHFQDLAVRRDEHVQPSKVDA